MGEPRRLVDSPAVEKRAVAALHVFEDRSVGVDPNPRMTPRHGWMVHEYGRDRLTAENVVACLQAELAPPSTQKVVRE